MVTVGAESSLLRKVRPFRCVARNLPPDGWAEEFALFRELLRARFGPWSVIYIHSQSLSARAALFLLGPLFGKRIVYHNPDYYDPFHHALYTFLEKRFCRKADLYLNNEFHRGYITRAIYHMKCPVVTVPIMLPACWPIPERSSSLRSLMSGTGGSEQPFIVIVHSGYTELRMAPELFQALTLLPNRFRLVMFDAAHRKAHVDSELERLGLADRVLRLPRLSVQEILAYTVNADAGALLYSNNDLGNFFTAPGRLTEYVASGLPVIATNHTGLENLVWRYDLGVTVDSTRPERIAAGLLELEDRKRRGEYARSDMREKFLTYLAFDHWEDSICQAFDELLLRRDSKQAPPPAFPWFRTDQSSIRSNLRPAGKAVPRVTG